MVTKFEVKEWNREERKPYNTAKAMVRGWVTKKQEKTTSSGTTYFQLNIAVNNNKEQDKTDWYIIRIYDVTIAEQIEPKDLITVKGYLSQGRVGDYLFVNVFPVEIIKHELRRKEENEAHDDDYDFFDED